MTDQQQPRPDVIDVTLAGMHIEPSVLTGSMSLSYYTKRGSRWVNVTQTFPYDYPPFAVRWIQNLLAECRGGMPSWESDMMATAIDRAALNGAAYPDLMSVAYHAMEELWLTNNNPHYGR